MNSFITSLIWVTVGSAAVALAIDQTELFPTWDALSVDAQCPSNCKGDFPVSSSRKYAERPTSFETSGVVRG